MKTNVIQFLYFFGGGGGRWEGGWGGKQRRYIMANQCGRKVVSNGTGLSDFAFGLVEYVFDLPDGQMKFLGEFKLRNGTVFKPGDPKNFLGSS